jgi:beclin 1
MRNTHVLTDLFKIESLGIFGTINGLRIGRTTSDIVPWEEINTGWGHCVLLVYAVMTLNNYSSGNFVLYPLGNASCIATTTNPANRFELYCSDNGSLLRFNEA